MSVRSRQEIKRGLLRRAFSENRGPAMIARILDHVHRAAMPPEHREAIETFDSANEMQPQAIRALNRLAEHVGIPTRYTDAILDNGPSQAIN